MRLVFVHGMRQEGLDPRVLSQAWQEALEGAWKRDGLTAPPYQLEMPYYGDVLHSLTVAARGAAPAIVTRGEGHAGTFSELEEQWIREMAAHAGVTAEEVRRDIGQEVVAKGIPNWEWVQGLARVLERRVPAAGRLGLGFVQQVDSYLTRPHIAQAVDAIVGKALEGSPAVVVAHSLGTVVSYKLMTRMPSPSAVRLFVTLGSPLGIEVVKKHLRPPRLARPKCVAEWLNGTDERDYVALHANLDATTFCDGIENVSDIENGEDAHLITDYLRHPVVSGRVHAMLAG